MSQIYDAMYNTYGDGSIPNNTIFRGMNIHLPAILMWTTGVQGFDTLPYHQISPNFFSKRNGFARRRNHCSRAAGATPGAAGGDPQQE